MELTTSNLIKIIIGVFIIVLVILGVYIAMKNYIIPYFSGIGFEEPKIDANTEFGKELIQDKNKIGIVDNEGYFVYQGKKTDVYFKENKIYLREYFGELKTGFWSIFLLNPIKRLKPNSEIGSLDNEGKISINKEVEYKDILNNAYKNGNEIYKIK